MLAGWSPSTKNCFLRLQLALDFFFSLVPQMDTTNNSLIGITPRFRCDYQPGSCPELEQLIDTWDVAMDEKVGARSLGAEGLFSKPEVFLEPELD